MAGRSPLARRAPGRRAAGPAPCGHEIGTFRVETLLGAGGTGEVYRAHDTKLGRAVAFKVLRGALSQDADRRFRFAQEARELALIGHG